VRPATWADRATLGLLVLAAASIGFERLDPSWGLTADLRMTNLRLVVCLALGAWLLGLVLANRLPRLPRSLAWPIFVWLGLLLVSAALAPTYQTQALAFVRDMAFAVAFGWAAYDVARGSSRQILIARAFALSGLGVAVIGLAEAANVQPVVAGLAGFRNQSNFAVGELPRVAATLAHPNIAAMLLGLAIPLQLAWIVSVRSGWFQLVLGLGAACAIVVVVLTVSRAGMLVPEIALGIMLLIGIRNHQAKLIVASFAAAVLLPVALGVVLLREQLMLLHFTSENVDNWYRASYSTPADVAADAGVKTTVPVRLQNTGDRTWAASGPHPFALSYHLEDASGKSVTYDGARTPLPLDVAPGNAIVVQAEIVAPTSQGKYVIEWDGVQEAVTWFSWVGTPMARTYLTVLGPAADVDRVPQTPVTSPPSTLAPPPPGRLMQWRIALRMARNRPLLGVGPDNFRWVYGDFAGVTNWDTGSHANSLYFEWLADTGLPALCVYFWLCWRLLRNAFTGLWTGRVRPSGPASNLRLWQAALSVSLTAWFLHGLFDYFYEPLPTNLAFWLVAGLALAVTESRRRNVQDEAECGLPST
jgi:O-antigen ligase